MPDLDRTTGVTGLIQSLFRDSIAARISLAVFGGLVLMQVVGFLLITGERLELLPLRNTAAIEAIVGAALDRVLTAAPGARPLAARSLAVPDGMAAWSSAFSPSGEIIDPPPFHELRDKLRQALGNRFDQFLVEAPYPPGQGPQPAKFRLWLRLPDRSWLVLTVPSRLLGRLDPFRLVLWWGLSLLGAIPLSLIVARRMTAPVRRFSEAAERLGTDIAAPPLPESGPAELRSAAGAFNAMQRRILRFVEDRTLMLAAISHDLRTPISRLCLRAQSLPASGDRRRMLEDLRLMDQIIATTLDFARDASAAETRSRVDLASLVESICLEMSDAGSAVAYRGPQYLEFPCRRLALSRAVRNVIENAAEYGSRAEADLVDWPDRVEIVVRDAGPGVPVEEQQRVFEPFYRLDRARATQHRGTGLGLSIARNILHAHGGDITLKNGAGGGLVVVMRLPRPAGTCD